MLRSQPEASLEPIWINILYDETLQRITKRALERTMCNRGCPFYFILRCVFVEYPDIQKRYPPGILGFTVDGMPPDINQPMRDGNIVKFNVVGPHHAVYAAIGKAAPRKH